MDRVVSPRFQMGGHQRNLTLRPRKAFLGWCCLPVGLALFQHREDWRILYIIWDYRIIIRANYNVVRIIYPKFPGIPLIVINEGRDKQQAAERITEQIGDFIKRHPYVLSQGESVDLMFDEGIIRNESKYRQTLQASSIPSVAASAEFASVRSHENALIQLADVLAGFNRLATEITLGRKNKQLLLREDPSGEDIQLDLLSYISISLRWAIWGEVPPPPNPNDVKFDAYWPFKYIGGYGFRIHSSIAPQTINQIYDSRVVYMGCMN